MVDQEKLQSIHKLQETELPELFVLRKESEGLQKRVRDMQADLDEQKSLLNKTLIDKDAIQRSLLDQKDNAQAAEKSSNEYKATLEVLRAATEGQDAGIHSALENRISQLQNKVESSREALVKRTEVMHSIDLSKALQPELREKMASMNTSAK